jgi:hypothetical protein
MCVVHVSFTNSRKQLSSRKRKKKENPETIDHRQQQRMFAEAVTDGDHGDHLCDESSQLG